MLTEQRNESHIKIDEGLLRMLRFRCCFLSSLFSYVFLIVFYLSCIIHILTCTVNPKRESQTVALHTKKGKQEEGDETVALFLPTFP
jgi:hypothetical protein